MGAVMKTSCEMARRLSKRKLRRSIRFAIELKVIKLKISLLDDVRLPDRRKAWHEICGSF